MSYQPNLTVGGYVRYQFSKRSSFLLQANYARLTASDVFLLFYLEIPEGYLSMPTTSNAKSWDRKKELTLIWAIGST